MTRTYLAAFVAALVSALIGTEVARRAALKLSLLDHPQERKTHVDPVPYLGGLAIVAAFSIAVTSGALLRGLNGSYVKIFALLGGALILAGVGLWDDLKVVPGWIKVPLEIMLGIGVFASGDRADLFHLWPLDLLLTLAWIVGVTNAINYMDNMDGLTAGVSAIAALFFFVLAGLNHQVLVGGLSIALVGCALGFLWYNRPPARIFMGDAGSLFLGFLLAGLGLDLRFQNIASITFFVPVAVLAIPILDALMVSISRLKRGLSPIQPGKDHASHRLVKIGIPSTAVVGMIYFASAACGWIGLVIAYSQPLTAYMLMGWLIVIGVFLGLLMLRVKV